MLPAFSCRLRQSLWLAMLVVASAARAELVEIRRSPGGDFTHRSSIAPGKFAEVCGKLTKGASIAWKFESSVPLNFNIHYHAGRDVVFPAKADGVSSSSGRLEVAVDQDYCWMWSNKASDASELRLSLER